MRLLRSADILVRFGSIFYLAQCSVLLWPGSINLINLGILRTIAYATRNRQIYAHQWLGCCSENFAQTVTAAWSVTL